MWNEDETEPNLKLNQFKMFWANDQRLYKSNLNQYQDQTKSSIKNFLKLERRPKVPFEIKNQMTLMSTSFQSMNFFSNFRYCIIGQHPEKKLTLNANMFSKPILDNF